MCDSSYVTPFDHGVVAREEVSVENPASEVEEGENGLPGKRDGKVNVGRFDCAKIGETQTRTERAEADS